MLIAALLLVQVTPTAPIVKGTGLPPPTSEEGAVMQPINAILRAISTRDVAAVEAQLLPNGRATVAMERPDGTRTVKSMAWSEWTAAFREGTQRLSETQGMPAIEVDGDIAMVWAPYTFSIDGMPRQCGMNHWDLVRQDGRWRVANVTWSVRTTGCAAQ